MLFVYQNDNQNMQVKQKLYETKVIADFGATAMRNLKVLHCSAWYSDQVLV